MAQKKEGEKKKRSRGRPRFEVDEQLLENIASCWATYEEIADILSVSTKTLQVGRSPKGIPYAEIIRIGRSKGNVSLRRKQFEMAMAGDPTMLRFLGMVQLGQKPKQEVELTVKNPPSLIVQFIDVELGPDGEPTHLLSEGTSDAPVIDMVPEGPKGDDESSG